MGASDHDRCVERIERVGDTPVAHLVLAVTRQTDDAAITATATAVIIT